MASVAPDPTPDGFAARVQAVQAKLAQSVARAGLKDDAYAHVIDAQSAVLGVLVEFTNEIRQVRQPTAALTDNQVGDIGRRLMSACQAWSVSLVRASLIRSWAALAATVLVALLIGGLVSWLAFGRPLNETCVDENGGRFCGQWVIPPRGR